MIFDLLANADAYASVHPDFPAVIAWLRANAATAEPGSTITICDGRVRCLPSAYTTHAFSEDRFEAHNVYLDVQYIVSGTEDLHVRPLLNPEANVTTPFDTQKDIGFWRAEAKPYTLTAGAFMVIYPHELHEPGCNPNASATPAPVRKIVVKMPL